MSSSVIQILVLGAVAVFLILKLRSVLGTREGFEKPPLSVEEPIQSRPVTRNFDVIEGGADRDITDNVPEGSPAAKALAAMKAAEPGFSVVDFLSGARGAYEMILMSFEKGDLAAIKPFLSDEVFSTFSEVVEARKQQGLTIESNFIGLRELSLQNATYDPSSKEAEVMVRFVGELTSVVRNKGGEVVEGSPTAAKRQRDSWTFARRMGSSDPNWQLVATGE